MARPRQWYGSFFTDTQTPVSSSYHQVLTADRNFGQVDKHYQIIKTRSDTILGKSQ